MSGRRLRGAYTRTCSTSAAVKLSTFDSFTPLSSPPELQQPAHPGGVRPRPEAARPPRPLGHPHLLQRWPQVGVAAVPADHLPPVRPHELTIHLQATPVGVAGVCP